MIQVTSDSSKNIALLIARVIVGGIFVFSGWVKVADMTATVSMFNTMSIPPSLTYIVSYGELLGGLLLILGLWAEYATFFLAVNCRATIISRRTAILNPRSLSFLRF